MKLTDAQQKAVDSIKGNILVSAAAGSGKTAVLVKRIINMLEKDNPTELVDIDELLIITFTNAAAAEMKNRISEEIRTNLKRDPARQLLKLNQSYITTFHAFGASVIDDFNYLLNLNPNYQIGEEAILNNIKNEIIKELLNETDYQLLVINYTQSIEDEDDNSLIDMLLKIYDVACSSKDINEWLDHCLFLQQDQTKYQQIILKDTYEKIDYIKSLINFSKALINTLNHEKTTIWFETLKAKINQIDKQEFMFYSTIDLSIIPTKPRLVTKDEYLKEVNEQLKNINNEIKKTLEKILKPYLIIKYQNQDKEQIDIIYQSIITLIKKFHLQYTKYKTAKGLLDFNDLEHYALELLSNEKVASFYRDKFKYIYVDEYQDTNDLQEMMINKISNYNVFYVGDIKQSIYGFRNAKPDLFRSKLNTFKTDKEKVILFDQNFRSATPIIDSVNTIFSRIMSVETGKIDYDDSQSLKPNNFFPDTNNSTTKILITDKSAKEYVIIAREIKQIVENKMQVFDRIKGYQDAKYKDITILLRNMTHADEFCRALDALDIPYYNVKDQTFFASDEISTFIYLLKAIEDPTNDFYFLHFLKLKKYYLTADQLASLKINYPKTKLYQAIKKDFLELYTSFNKYRSLLLQMNLTNFLNFFAYDTEYIYDIQQHPFGRQRLANLEQLIIMANNFVTLKEFIEYCKYIKEFPSAAIYGKDENVVKIMSIHASKGLQFPIVICPQLDNRKTSGKTNPIQGLTELGIGLKYKDIKNHYQYACSSYHAINCYNESDSVNEEMRIYYVALTRAQQKLILSGVQSIKKLNNFNSYRDIPLPIHIKNKTCLLTWTLLALVQDPEFNFGIEKKKSYSSNLFELHYIEEVEPILNRKKETSNNLPKKINPNSMLPIPLASEISTTNLDVEQFNKLHTGNIIHYMMHHIDFTENIDNQISIILNKHPNNEIKNQLKNSFNSYGIKKLLNSDLGKRMINATKQNQLYKEYKIFNTVTNSIGIIDCFFIENDQIILIDYKSDIILNNDKEKLIKKYGKQLLSYQKSLYDLFNLPITTMGIYSFYLNEFIELTNKEVELLI